MSEQFNVGGKKSDVTADLASPGPRYRAALQRLLPILQAMTPAEFSQPVTVDIPMLVTSTMGHTHAGIMKYRPAMAKLEPFDITLIDMLEDVLMALAHAQVLLDAAYGAAPELQVLFDDSYDTLNIFLGDAHALVRRGLLNGDQLKELRGANGYRNVAFDLMTVAQMLLADFDRIEGRTGTTREELVKAEKLAEKLTEAIGLREKAPAAIQAASEMRQRVYNLFLKCYNEAKRGITFIRWDYGDYDTIVPSIFVGRAGKRKPSAEPKAPEPQAPPPTSAEPAPATGAAKPGLPGGNPFEDES